MSEDEVLGHIHIVNIPECVEQFSNTHEIVIAFKEDLYYITCFNTATICGLMPELRKIMGLDKKKDLLHFRFYSAIGTVINPMTKVGNFKA